MRFFYLKAIFSMFYQNRFSRFKVSSFLTALGVFYLNFVLGGVYMSDACAQNNRTVRRQRSIYQVHYGLQKPRDENMARPLAAIDGTGGPVQYSLQVAGHMTTEQNKYLGVLQCNNGTILKPIIKEQQKREVDFYTRLHSTKDSALLELKRFVPMYYGCRKFTYNGFEQDYIVLENLNERMLEPCIMDVKIGRRTWDPLATEEKIQREKMKYLCKEEFGFCIPGYQVHRLDGKVCKYGKEHGKKLCGQGVVNALRNFLNGATRPLCRALILQFLSQLWRILNWAARQTAVTLYCASLLLVYDAARLRSCCGETDSKCRSTQPIRRRQSIHSISPPSGSFSGQLCTKGPVYNKINAVPTTAMSLAQNTFTAPNHITSPWTEALEKLNHSHSFEHNYEDKLCKIKMNYRAVLDQLSEDSPNPNPWGTVKIIDFAHAFFNDDEEGKIDENFRDGVESLVKIFEEFLKETDDQVF